MSAYLSAAQTKFGEVKAKAMAVSSDIVNQIQAKAVVAKETIQSAPSVVTAKVQEVTQSAKERIFFVKDTALAWQEEVRSKGLKTCSLEVADFAKKYALDLQNRAVENSSYAKQVATTKAKQIYTDTSDLVAKDSFKTTAASAAAGAVTMAAGGAATGAVTGGVAGALAGLPLALFTFGLSIPIGAAVGGGAGAVVGTAAGATAGSVTGGAAGYGVYCKKDEIRSAAGSIYSKASDGASAARGKANETMAYAKGAVRTAKERLAQDGKKQK